MTHRATLLLGCLPAVLAAQTPLTERIAAGARGTGFGLLHERPVAELVDALVPLHGELRSNLWARATSLVTPLQPELEALWRDEPAKRRARAAVFAAAMQGWARFYQQAGSPEERADIETVARFVAPFRHHTDPPGLPESHAAWLEAATRLQRITVAAIHAGPNPYPDQLRRTDVGYDLLRLVEGLDAACSPFHLTSVLVDPDPMIRARTATALRRMLGLDPTPWLAAAVADDPAVAMVRLEGHARATGGSLTDADVAGLALQIDQSDFARSMAVLEHTDGLSNEARTRLAKALIAAALRAPVDPLPAHGGQPAARTPQGDVVGSARAKWCFAKAAGLGPTQFQLVLALAVNTDQEHVAERVVEALAGHWDAPASELPGAAGLLIALLDHRNDAIARGACTIATRMLERRAEPALRARVVDLALAALSKDATTVAFVPSELPAWATGLPQLDPPATKEAAWVKAAAALGEVRLIEPLIAELQRCLAADPVAPHGDSIHEWFVLDCLGDLAHLVDAKQARTLHELLSADALTPNAWLDNRARALRKQVLGLNARLNAAAMTPHAWKKRRMLLRREVVFGIYATVPSDLLPWYVAAVADADIANALVRRLEPVAHLVPEDRAKQALEAADRHFVASSALWLRAPELLTLRWQADDEMRGDAMKVLQDAWPKQAERIVQLVAAGRLPRELAAASIRTDRTPLHVLAQVMPRGDADAGGCPGLLAAAIRKAPAAAPEIDLRALRELTTALPADVALAAAIRAATLGPEGLPVARTTFARLVAAPDPMAGAEALRAAVELGIELPGLTEVVARLRPSLAADAAALRFLGLDPRECRSGSTAEAIVLAKVDVELAVLRAALGDGASAQLPRLLRDGSIGTLVSSLHLAKELPWWSESIEKSVTWRTGHADPRVRLAAYEALRSRDADVWACALLVHEAVFDPDPAVQQFGRNPAR